MKTIIICFFLGLSALRANDLPGTKKVEPVVPAESFWVKSEIGMWKASYNVWYKIDKKSSNIKLSYNKKRWKSSLDAAWHDNFGVWYCISNNTMMSSVNGKNWKVVTNRTWQDVSGTWFRFDNQFNLYEVVQ